MFKLLHYHRFGFKLSAKQHCWLLIALMLLLGSLMLLSPELEAKILPQLVNNQITDRTPASDREDIFERPIFDTPAEPPIISRHCRFRHAKTPIPAGRQGTPAQQPDAAKPPAVDAAHI